ncbi:MAG: hypothetical protein K2M43_01310 [Mycoplasmoidaceae bacterium]|nr:hypothetical protein [Mycoplasmoidaceae bacterium]
MLDKLSTESSIIKEYKTKIDALNPKILNSVTTDTTLASLLSIDKKDYAQIENLKELSNLIEDQKAEKNFNEIDEFLNSDELASIIDSKSGEISETWLSEDPNYRTLKDTQNKLTDLSKMWESFQIVSKDQADKLDELAKSKNTYESFQKHKISPLDEKSIKTKSYKKMYIASLAVCIALLAIMIVLVVLKLKF